MCLKDWLLGGEWMIGANVEAGREGETQAVAVSG